MTTKGNPRTLFTSRLSEHQEPCDCGFARLATAGSPSIIKDPGAGSQIRVPHPRDSFIVAGGVRTANRLIVLRVILEESE
jgi:hypothetical protein